jgi:GNAT superfamily N-acetyltransferase
MKRVEPNAVGFLREDVMFFARGTRHQRRKKLSADIFITWEQGEAVSDGEAIAVEQVDVNIWHRNSPERIGYYQGYIILCSDLDIISFYCLCDEHSQPLCDFAGELMKSRFGLSRFTRDGEILFPHLLEILPAWRGQGIGAAVFKFMLKFADLNFGASVCAFHPYPLQFKPSENGEEKNPETSRAYDAALKSLRNYYINSFGAKPLQRDSHYYYIRLW